jgi:uncharacterized protein (TIGR03435 family)
MIKVVISIVMVAVGAFAQSTRPEFEVAVVKPSPPPTGRGGGGGIRAMPGGQTYNATNVPVKLMIKLMYHLNDRQISGGPGWLDTDRFDVNAKADRPHSLEELHVMFQNLLVDRFKLQFHMETKELQAFALVVDKSGSKMTENDGPEMFEIPVKGAGFGKFDVFHCSMSYFSWFLAQQQAINSPVFDQTGLAGFYDFKLEFTPELPENLPQEVRDRVPASSGPDLMTALRQELGLKLESRKMPVPVMVIDHAEKPAEN